MQFEHFENAAHSLESALSIFQQQRQEVIKYLLSIERQLWRFRVSKNSWSVAQIVEYNIQSDRFWWFSFQLSFRLFRFLPMKPIQQSTIQSSPFTDKNSIPHWWFLKPSGKYRRKYYFQSLDTFSQKLVYTCENLNPILSQRLRMYSPYVGFVSLVDSIILLFYLDKFYFTHIRGLVEQLSNK
ncbi:MAG: hypothetical protein N2450_03220 [bacterium]|nr:hypothetical protein [bacterium]